MTLLIVEDEDIIRQGLIVTIHKLALNFEQIYEAGNGLEGLEICQEYKPDIILTDIKMPRMNGLDFIKKSKSLLPNSQYIILSGYNDFEYARTAIQYGVKDYLLKPSTKNEIKKVMTRVISGHLQSQAAQEELTRRIDVYEEKLEHFQGLLIGNILLGRYSLPETEGYLSHYSITFPSELMLVICTKIIPGTKDLILPPDYKYHYEWLESQLNRYGTVYSADIMSAYKCLLLNLTPKKFQLFLQEGSILEETLNVYGKSHNLLLFCSFSNSGKGTASLPAMYSEACQSLHNRLFLPDKMLFGTYKRTEPVIPSTLIQTMYHSFLKSSPFDLRQDFLAFVRHIADIENASSAYFIACIKAMEQFFSTSFIKNQQSSNVFPPLNLYVNEAMAAFDTIEDLTEELFARLRLYWEAKREGTPSVSDIVSSPVNQAIAYIEQNYYLDLELGMLAGLASMNSSYFSTLFKKKTGLNFTTYLQHVRIEKSKHLLLDSNKKLYEISESVGIPNVKYFCRLFKESTGVTPSEFRGR